MLVISINYCHNSGKGSAFNTIKKILVHATYPTIPILLTIFIKNSKSNIYNKKSTLISCKNRIKITPKNNSSYVLNRKWHTKILYSYYNQILITFESRYI